MGGYQALIRRMNYVSHEVVPVVDDEEAMEIVSK